MFHHPDHQIIYISPIAMIPSGWKLINRGYWISTLASHHVTANKNIKNYTINETNKVQTKPQQLPHTPTAKTENGVATSLGGLPGDFNISHHLKLGEGSAEYA